MAMNDDDILDYIEDSRNYRALGTDLEFDYDDNDMLVLKPYVEPSLLENIGGGLQRVGAALVGTGAGAVGATLGLPTDLVGLINGIKDAVSAEDGKKLDAFSSGFSEFSKGGIIPGSEFYKDAWDKTVDSLETYSPEMKEDAKAAFTLGEFIGLEQTAVKGAKAIPKIAKSIKPKLQEVGEQAQERLDANEGSMTMSSMGVGEMGKMVDKGLSKLAPTQEIDSLKIMSSEDFKIPSKGPKVKIDDIMEYYETQPKLNIENPNDFSKMVNQAAEEVKYQLDQDVTGIGWYDTKLKNAMSNLDNLNSKFKDNPQSKDFVVFLTAITSPGTAVGQDFKAATQIADIFLNTNNVPSINPITGKGWTRYPAPKMQLKFVDAVIKDKGLDGFLDFIYGPTTRRKLNEYRQKLGFNKISGPLDKEIVGADAFGPKVSKFMQNLLGTSDENVPDVWFTRGFNRKRGTMFNVTQDGNRTMIMAPRTLKERQLMDKYIEDTKNQLKTKYNIELNNRDTQAVLWYFEQGLYTKLGVRSEPTDYETITRTLIKGKSNDSKGGFLPSAETKTKNQKTTAEPITTGETPDG